MNKNFDNKKSGVSSQMAVYRFILMMVLQVGVGIIVLLGVFLGMGIGLDRLFDTSPFWTIVFIVLSAPMAMVLIFLFIRKQTKHLSQKNIVENPDLLTKNEQGDGLEEIDLNS